MEKLFLIVLSGILVFLAWRYTKGAFNKSDSCERCQGGQSDCGGDSDCGKT